MEKAGLGNVPIISLNVNGMNEQPGFELNLAMIKKFMAAIIYGDTLMYLANKTRPYALWRRILPPCRKKRSIK